MANLSLRSLTKAYGQAEVLHGIDLDVADGEFVVFVGPSGCGKSTTLRMIAGLEEVTSGEVVISDRIVNHLEPKERDIAMVFQNYAIYPHMSVKKNIAFGLRSSKMSRADKAARIAEVAGILDMTHLLDRKPAQLRTQMRLEIKKLHQRVGNTIIFATHDQVEAMTMADRIVIMKDGHIQQVGTPAEVYHSPVNTFVAQFIGAPSMNMLSGVLNGGGITLASGQSIVTAHASATIQPILLGVRPDDLTLSDGGEILATGQVTLREPLGAETLIYVATGAGEVIAKADGRAPPEVGAQVTLSTDPANIHVFDADSGAVLT